jgi:hypothetical protein
MSAARGVVNADDERVRVTTWTFDEAGAATGYHLHALDYIVVPVTGGSFTVVDANGSERELEQVAGTPYLGTAGTEHDVINATDGVVVFVEIELKG